MCKFCILSSLAEPIYLICKFHPYWVHVNWGDPKTKMHGIRRLAGVTDSCSFPKKQSFPSSRFILQPWTNAGKIDTNKNLLYFCYYKSFGIWRHGRVLGRDVGARCDWNCPAHPRWIDPTGLLTVSISASSDVMT